jgi:ABC-2 type transport system permease protein
MNILSTTRLLAGILGRRILNRAFAVLPGGRRKSGERTGTARKRVGGLLVTAGVALIFAFNSFLQGYTLLQAVAVAHGPLLDGEGRMVVSKSTLQTLDSIRQLSEGARRENLRNLLMIDGLLMSPGARDIQDHWADKLQVQHRAHGAAGFRTVERSLLRPFPMVGAWSNPEGRRGMIGAGALLLGMLAVTRFFLALSAARQDLGRVEWTTEWLFTFPVPDSHLFAAQILGLALVDFFSWIAVFPVLWVYFYGAGLGWWSLGAALAGMVGFGLASAGLQVGVETFLRKRLSLSGLKNVQALATLVASVSFLGLYFFGRSPAAADRLLAVAQSLPLLALWNPLTCAALGAEGWAELVAAVGAGTATAWVGVMVCTRLVRHGLLDTRGGAFAGRRTPSPGGRRVADQWFPVGIVGKELRLLFRDRSRLVQALALPALGYVQLVWNQGLMEHLKGDFRACAACAFGMGAMVLVPTCLTVLANDSRALWFLNALPVSIHGVLLRKTQFWMVPALAYALVVLVLAGLQIRHLLPTDFLTGVIALLGVGIYAYLAAGIGILRTDPLETEPQRRVPPSATYLYMLLMAMYGYSLYAPSLWAQVVQLFLSALLAGALWQKARERIPYLLDPVSAPPPRVSAADGLIAVLAFFVLQGLLFLAGIRLKLPEGPAIVGAFGVAGILVAGFYLWVTRGSPGYFDRADGRPPVGWLKALGTGLVGGGVAAVWAGGYLVVAQQIPYLKGLLEEVHAIQSVHGLWLVILAVVAAPLAEEFLFRGLLYRGLRREYSAVWAVCGSALLFAMMHPPGGAVAVFGMGVVSAVVLEKTGRLWASMVVHGVYNGCAVAAVLLAGKG